ncbi:hypothetical protein GCM10009616_33900 [Microlunatus lacustris]
MAYSPQVRARFDILGFDPRGVARSTPATCFATPAQESAWSTGALPYPVTPAEQRRFQPQSRTLAQSCADTSRQRFNHISTADRFRGLPVGTRIEQDRGGDEVFEEFLARCRAAGAQRCSLAALCEPATVARRVLDGLKSRPVEFALPDGSTLEITYQIAVATVYSNLYSPTNWAGLADLLAQLAVGQQGAVARADGGVAALLQSAAPRSPRWPAGATSRSGRAGASTTA